ncbi:MAG: hypothetical protein ACYCWE_17575 [Eubacteriales bacterium]
MFSITEGKRIVDGYEVTTYTREVTNCNVLEVEAGTNGYKDGGPGRGSRTYFRIFDLVGTNIEVNALGRNGVEGLEVSLGGDSELDTIIAALKFITKVLEDGAKGVRD